MILTIAVAYDGWDEIVALQTHTERPRSANSIYERADRADEID